MERMGSAPVLRRGRLQDDKSRSGIGRNFPRGKMNWHHCSFAHAIGGLSENDFILAAKIDELPIALKPTVH